MKHLYILITVLFITITAQAQNLLKGKVTDSSSQLPLAGANVQIEGKGGTVTDKDGMFSFECSGSVNITVSYIGFVNYSTTADCGSELNIALTPSQQTLSAVEITATSAINQNMLSQPVSIAKLGMTEIKRGNGLFLDDAINANIPGVFMQRRTISAGQQFNIRGYGGGGPGVRGTANNFDGLGVKAYLNGIPITDAEGITVMDDIDFGSLGNVEITKGPSGTLYGLAIAGVINLQTQRAERDRTSVSQDVLVGSYGLNRLTTRVQISKGNSNLMINYGRMRYDGFMNHTNSRKDFVNAMGEFQLNEKQSLTTYFGFSDSYDARNGELTIDQYNNFDYSGNPAYIKNDAHSNIISFRAGVAHRYNFTRSFSNNTVFFGTGQSNNASSAGGWTDKAPVNFGFRTTFDARLEIKPGVTLTGITGIEAQKQYAQIIGYGMVTNNADPAGYNIIGPIRSNQTSVTSNYSLFTQWTLSLPHDISITAGLGSSNMNIMLNDKLYVAANNTPTNKVPTTYANQYNGLIAPSLAVNKIVNKHISVYASYNQGFRAPTASNIYTPLAGTVNTSLRPEKGNQLELGSKGSAFDDKLVYEIAYFNMKFTDKMTAVAVPNAAGTATAYTYTTNSGGQTNNGVELLLKYLLISSKTGFLTSLRPYVNYAYSDFKYNNFFYQNNALVAPSDYSGLAVAGVPKHTFNAGVDFMSRPGLYGNITYLFRDSMPFTSDGLNTASSYSLLNGKIGFRKMISSHVDLDAYFGVNNITGVQYYQMVFVNQLPDAYIPAPNNINYYGGVNFKYIF
ncbi:MAG: TonB-dependent receptor [Bacteroidetes bacterium]|nr:TonB-dependent receptor [Bacteroidota bacterium]